MKKRILSLVLASILVAGMAGIVSTADNEVGDFATGTTTRIAEIDPGESTTEEIEDEPVYTTAENVEPKPVVRAQSIMFQSDSGYTTSASTNMIGGVELGKTAGDLLGALKNGNGVAVMRGDTALANEDAIASDDALVLTDEAGKVKSKMYVVIMGNANRDGDINLSDVTAVLKKIAAWDVSIDTVAADVDANGTINLSDVTTMLKVIAGWNVKFTRYPVLPNGGIIKTYAESATQSNINLRKGQDLAIKFTVDEGFHGKSVKANYPSWADSKGSIRLSLYKWNTDYATTVAAEPITTKKYENFADCQAIEFAFKDADGEYIPAGDYLWRIHEGYDERVNPDNESEPVGVGMFTYDCPAASTGLTVFFEGVAMVPGAEGTFGPVANINIIK